MDTNRSTTTVAATAMEVDSSCPVRPARTTRRRAVLGNSRTITSRPTGPGRLCPVGRAPKPRRLLPLPPPQRPLPPLPRWIRQDRTLAFDFKPCSSNAISSSATTCQPLHGARNFGLTSVKCNKRPLKAIDSDL